METKRCAYCHKLQRADAQVCSRCGQAFVPKKSRPSTREWTKPSLPPASPHTAGHYSGLHPEDQPYQSSLIAIQRPPSQDSEHWHAPQHEPERIVLPMVDPESDPGINRQHSLSTQYDTFSAGELPAGIEPPPYMPRKRLLPPRAIPILLTISCIFFLLASSILAFVLIGRSSSPTLPIVTASPTQLRTNDTFTLTGSGFGSHSLMTFTYDINKTILDGNNHPLQAHTNAQGAFAVQIQVPRDWEPGQHFIHATDEAEKLSVSATITIQQPPVAPPVLQLSINKLNFDADAPGVVSDKTISLVNAGGGQITWQQSSDQSWLTASPGNGIFSGRESVRITVNRGTLAPQAYSGHITFTPKDSNIASSVILTVTMAVKAAPATLTISPSTLDYSASPAQNPGSQTIVLQNSGGQSVNWKSTVSTGDGASWLAISPTSGTLLPAQSVAVTVSVQSQQLAVGSYQGTITFAGGAHGQVNVALAVTASGDLVVSPPSLSFPMVVGQQPVYKAIILQNSGNQTLYWIATTTTSDQGNWLHASPGSGSLAAGAEGFMNAKVDVTGLKPGSYQGTLTLNVGGVTRQVAISLTVS